MANLIELIHTNRQPMVRTDVSADYCFNRAYFQIRTYRNGDTRRTEGQTQNIQLTQDMAKKLAILLKDFIKQD